MASQSAPDGATSGYNVGSPRESDSEFSAATGMNVVVVLIVSVHC